MDSTNRGASASSGDKSQLTTDTLKEQNSSNTMSEQKLTASLLARLKLIEEKIGQTSSKAKRHAFFKRGMDDNDAEDHPANRRRRESDLLERSENKTLSEQQLATARHIWQVFIKLHLMLADTCLDLTEMDPVYAERKQIEGYCWKRAIYSLVEQFRLAFKVRAESSQEEDAVVNDTGVVVTDTGMIVMDDESSADEEEEVDRNDPDQTLEQELSILRSCFAEFLSAADERYCRLVNILYKADHARKGETLQLDTMDQQLSAWRRPQNLRWLRCIIFRGDLARYRWAYTFTADQTKEKQAAYEEAWRWYMLGSWLLPSSGKCYFHLSQLYSLAHGSNRLGDIHTLSFGVQSIMVSQNPFMSARECLMLLFEKNRQWYNKNVMPSRSKPKRKEKSTDRTPSDKIVAGALIRLHGLLFTKTDLDRFGQVKRHFFDTLFPFMPTLGDDGEETQVKAESAEMDMFWLDNIMLGSSSLYQYNYSSAKLTKLLSLNRERLFGDGSIDLEPFSPLLSQVKEDVLFAYSIDLVCQLAIAIFQVGIDSAIPPCKTPSLPPLPKVPLSLGAQQAFVFNAHQDTSPTIDRVEFPPPESGWIVYIEILLFWMMTTGICIQREKRSCLWETLIGTVVTASTSDDDETERLISSSFWPLLAAFANTQLQMLTADVRDAVINYFVLAPVNDTLTAEDDATLLRMAMQSQPMTHELQALRGLGWMEDAIRRAWKSPATSRKEHDLDLDMGSLSVEDLQRIQMLSCIFVLTKQMDGVLAFDAVQGDFSLVEPSQQRDESPTDATLQSQNVLLESDAWSVTDLQGALPRDMNQGFPDAFGLDGDGDDDDDDDDDDHVSQLKQRREELQSMLAQASKAKNTKPERAYRRARLDPIKERVLSGQTTLVLDTNCFIGHLDAVKRLVVSGSWLVVVPFVVVIELDGLRGNSPPLGTVATDALAFIDEALSAKPRRSLRIQTSHHNFIYDISVRSEQFAFGDNVKNLDDLVLSACLWWVEQSSGDHSYAPVCLVTADRNLSVKARARDVDVAPLSALLQLTPKQQQQQ